MKVEGSGAMVEIQQGTGIEVGREGSGVDSDRWVKRKERIGTEEKIDGCTTELPFAMECYPEGRRGRLYMAVVLNIAVVGEDRDVQELTEGVVYVALQQVLKQEKQYWPVQGTAVIQADLVLEVD